MSIMHKPYKITQMHMNIGSYIPTHLVWSSFATFSPKTQFKHLSSITSIDPGGHLQNVASSEGLILSPGHTPKI